MRFKKKKKKRKKDDKIIPANIDHKKQGRPTSYSRFSHNQEKEKVWENCQNK